MTNWWVTKISGGTDQTQAFSSKCVDASFAVQTSGTMETNWTRKRMNPLLSLLSALAGQRTFLGGGSFRAFVMATPLLPFHASMRLDRSLRIRMCRMPECKATASQNWRHIYEINTWMWSFGSESGAFRWSRLKGYAESPSLKRPAALMKSGRPGSVQRKRISPAEYYSE